MFFSLALAWVGQVLAADLVLRDVHVVDALGPRDVAAIVIRDGKIASMGDVPADAADLPVIDASGATVLPGLFDAHVHLSQQPGQALRDDPPERREALERHALRAYLACGVTGVLDAGILPEEAEELRAWLAAGQPGPDVWFLGPILSPTDGYPHTVIPSFPDVADAGEVNAQIEAFARLEPVGVKLTVERGAAVPVWPLYNDEIREAIFAETRARGLRRYVHAMSGRAHRRALALEPHAIVHGPTSASRRAARQQAERGTYVVSTLSIHDQWLTAFQPERLDDPLYHRAVPEIERATATDPLMLDAYQQAVARALTPGLGALRGVAVAAMRNPRMLARRLARAQRAIQLLHERGVPLVLGSDSGSWPVIPFSFHGPSTVRELELLVEAGLSPLEAITAGTRTPARMLGLLDRGTVEVGKRADLVVVSGDPLTDISVMRQIQWVLKDGEARTPEAWMREDAR